MTTLPFDAAIENCGQWSTATKGLEAASGSGDEVKRGALYFKHLQTFHKSLELEGNLGRFLRQRVTAANLGRLILVWRIILPTILPMNLLLSEADRTHQHCRCAPGPDREALS